MTNTRDQLEIMKERLLTAGMSRREVMKVAAAATAGTAAATVIGGSFASAAPSSRYFRDARHQDAEPDADQTLYQDGRYENPVSNDFNANLYCNGPTEPWSGLLQFDADLNAAADWAETWAPNEDATVWTFNIRKDNKGWSDGTPVTANDFVWSWTRQLDPATAAPYAGFLFDIKNAEAFNTGAEGITGADLGVKAIDDWTLEVTMEGPRGYFPQVVAYIAAVPAPRWMVEEHGEKWALGGDVPLVSSGPFKLDVWEPDVKLEMSKNEGYWDAANVKLTKIIAPIHPSTNNLLMYESGTGDQKIDWTNVAAADYVRYLNDPELSSQLSPYVYPGLWMMLPSNGQAPFDKLEVRKALSHAIDRSRLVEVTQGLAAEAYCMVPQGVFGYLDDPSLAEIQNFDPEAAMAALVGTEFEGGQNWPEITMWMRASEENYNADVMAADIVDQLKQNLGMDVKIQPVPLSNFVEQLYENTWQLVFIRWWLDYPDPNNCYGDMFYSQKSSGKRQAWSNAEFDGLVDQGKGQSDPAERLATYLQAEKVIQEDVGYMPLVYRLDNYVFKPWVKGVPVNSQGYQVPNGNIFVGMCNTIYISGRPAE